MVKAGWCIMSFGGDSVEEFVTGDDIMESAVDGFETEEDVEDVLIGCERSVKKGTFVVALSLVASTDKRSRSMKSIFILLVSVLDMLVGGTSSNPALFVLLPLAV